MPSRPPEPPPPSLQHGRHRLPPFILPVAAAAAAFALLFLLLALLLRKLSLRRSATSDLNQPRHFSYSALRRATSSFSPSNKLGQGGFGSVYRGILPSYDHPLAIKAMDAGSFQGDREFHNELGLAPQINGCDHIVSLLGYSHHRRGSRLLLVYELMPNGSLQDALIDSRRPELMAWGRRFSVALDVAKGLLFLHCSCNPPIIHGDVKPSNILLDCDFSAKIADFGLARVMTTDLAIDIASPEGKKEPLPQQPPPPGSDDESVLEETESVTTVTTTTVFEDMVGNGSAIAPVELSRSPEEASNSEALEKASASEGNLDKASVDSGKEGRWGGRKRRAETGGSSDSSVVKDYVMEWIGKEIRKERPKTDWIASDGKTRSPAAKTDKKKQQRRMEWWASLDEERARKKKCRPARAWWREEYCEDLAKKSKKRITESNGGSDAGEQWWLGDEAESTPEKQRKKKKNRSRSQSSVDWWTDGLSGEFRFGRRCSLDGGSEIPKSGGISSTPSMRGTVCYVAPEYGGGGPPSEKCDVYSYGVLLLVIIAGRRPLQVTGSPMSEFERANLISWARHLARRGKLLDLVDPAIQELDREQAVLCITIALLCLQRSPSQRPTIKQVVGMLSGQCEPPHLPVEFSPSPPSAFRYSSRKKAR